MLRLDSHPDACLRHPYDVLEGWISGEGPVAARLNGMDLTVTQVPRPDLGSAGAGFRAYVDLTAMPTVGASMTLEVVNAAPASESLTMAAVYGLAFEVEAAGNARKRKRAWLESRLQAGQSGEQTCAAMSLLDPASGFSGSLAEKRDGVSAHPYPRELEALLAERGKDPGFMALDFGAGFKRANRSNVIFHEVFDYPSTDILSLGQKLPFEDACFDMVITLAVLEHVDDPFACAKEIVRVLKPGGIVFSGIPFMQPEHGYPDHYFNATRSGHKQLYGKAIEVLEHFVADHQHPFLSLQWILRSYLLGLPEEARAAMSGMTVGAILSQRYWRDRNQAHISGLGEQATWELASATTLVGRKL